MIDSLDGREADALTTRGRPLQITYGYVSGRKAGGSVAGTLREALRRNGRGAVIVSTRRIERLDQYRDVLAAADAGAPS
jgi:D-threo-aldose 1-dehydrogenase